VGAPIHEVAPARYPVSWYQQFGATFRDFAGFPNWTMLRSLYASARSNGCKVVLNGTGGDEWLGAVGDWRSTALAARQWSLVGLVRQDAAAGGYRHAATELLRWLASEFLSERCKEWVRYRRGLPVPSAWLSPELSRTLRGRRRRADTDAARVGTGDDVWSAQLALLRDADGQMGRESAERQTAMCGVERRQPFWDQRIVEAAFATPEWLRARHGDDKWLHRRTMEGLLPPAILTREDKADFLVMAQQQRQELAAAMQFTLGRRSSWVRAERVRPPAEYVGRGALADFGQWALLMADALAPRPGASQQRSRKEQDMSSSDVQGRGGENAPELQQARTAEPVAPVRKPYQAPRLVVHGSVRELTLGGQGASPDAQSKKKAKPPKKSDRSVKQDILRIGTHPLGIGLYLFEYRPGLAPRGARRRHFGVMADEVEQVMPQAVSRDRHGVRQVDHELLGITDLAQQIVH
jgi:hypothetical protein